MSQTQNAAIAVVGIDIGKNSFHIVGHDERGAIVLRQKWSRGQVEARSRKLNSLGHNARLMPAKYVRPYSRGQKNDFRDAEAIAEAVQPLRHPRAPSLSLTGFRLVIADHALGLPVLRTLSLCTCRRQYPGAAAGRILRSSHPAISAFPDMAVGSACTSSFSRLAQRSLALRPAHSRCHQFVTR